MKPRYTRLSFRKLLRAAVTFEYQGKTYKAGEVFDWAAMNMKPYFVRKLYAMKQIRHYWEDAKTVYPKRNMPKDIADSSVPHHEKKAALHVVEAAAVALNATLGAYAGGLEIEAEVKEEKKLESQGQNPDAGTVKFSRKGGKKQR